MCELLFPQSTGQKKLFFYQACQIFSTNKSVFTRCVKIFYLPSASFFNARQITRATGVIFYQMCQPATRCVSVLLQDPTMSTFPKTENNDGKNHDNIKLYTFFLSPVHRFKELFKAACSVRTSCKTSGKFSVLASSKSLLRW